MTVNRFFSTGIACALCACLAGAAWSAPAKHTKKSAHPKASPAPPAPALPSLAPLPVAPAATPAPAPGDTVLYDGLAPADEGLALTPWGGGSVEDSRDVSFSKGHALKITTLDPYQGARLAFTTPAALGDLSDKTRFLALTIRLTNAPRTITQPADGGRGGRNYGGPGGYGGGRRRGGGRRGGGGYTPPAPGPMQTFETSAPSFLGDLHLTFTFAGGAQTDVLRPLPPDAEGGTDQWVNVAIPLSALTSPASGAALLQSLTIAGEDYAVFYVGQIRLTQDATPITCFAGDQQTVAVGQPVTLRGNAGGGLSTLQYAWDFDDRDGVTEQAYGPSVTTAYLKPGTYKVTLTVSDIDGLKKPATSTTEVRVQ